MHLGPVDHLPCSGSVSAFKYSIFKPLDVFGFSKLNGSSASISRSFVCGGESDCVWLVGK